MKSRHDLSTLNWTLEGYTPFIWKFERLYGGMGSQPPCVDVPTLPAKVPGSVQGALLQARLLPDWKSGLNYRQWEWVENRHWIYSTMIPDEWIEPGKTLRLECDGLDYSGWIYVNRQEAGIFRGTHHPHIFDLTSYLHAANNLLEIIFDTPPRWLGQFGYTSQMKEWKTRFNYTWDWSPRLVQVGIWDQIFLVCTDGAELSHLRCFGDFDIQAGSGILHLSGKAEGAAEGWVEINLEGHDLSGLTRRITLDQLEKGYTWRELPVQAWWPNLAGDQPLYHLTCRLLDPQGQEHDQLTRTTGFKHVEWQPCEGAPAGADPWLCVVNGKAIFLQGVNFPPLLANFADATEQDYRVKLSFYQEMGLNCFRINACQFLEKTFFYDLCDTLGFLVWQEFPLTSSGIDNWPPEDAESVEEMAEIAASYIERRAHHVSLLLWCGGNELQGDLAGHHYGIGKPCDLSHPMLKRLGEVVEQLDPIHRYLPTSPSGPRAGADPAEFGLGLHWDVHGGASILPDFSAVETYCQQDDALFRSETYCPGASSSEVILKYAGSLEPWPPTTANPYWTRLTSWWNDWSKVVNHFGRPPANLEEYVSWSQQLQAEWITAEMKACKDRFPRCGGVLHWSGHDTFPLAINSSFIDFDNHPKLSAQAVKKVWRE
jgi:beta-mannosidase